MSKDWGKGSRQKKKKCKSPKVFPCKFACIPRMRGNTPVRCFNPATGIAKTSLEWLKDQEEKLKITNQKRSRKGLTPARLTDGYIKADKPIKKESFIDNVPKLGKPIYDRVTTPEEAIANGYAIAGEWIEKLKTNKKRRNVTQDDLSVVESEYLLENISRRNGVFRTVYESYTRNIDKLGKVKGDQYEYDRIEKEVLYWQKEFDKVLAQETQKLDVKYGDKIKQLKTELSSIDNEADNFVRELINSSSLSEEKAQELVTHLKLPKEIVETEKKAIADFIRLTNGQSMETLTEVSYTQKRAKANKGKGSITFPKGGIKTLWHEMGHHVEYADHNKRALVGSQFIHERATGDPEKLSVLTGNVKYKRNEFALPDKFIDPYVGKIYSDDVTEVISMGIDTMTSGKTLLNLIQKDPDHLALTIGIVKQSYTLPEQTRASVKGDRKKEFAKVVRSLKANKKEPVEKEGGLYKGLDYGDFLVQYGKFGAYIKVDIKNKETAMVVLTNKGIGKKAGQLMIDVLTNRPELIKEISERSADRKQAEAFLKKTFDFTYAIAQYAEDLPVVAYKNKIDEYNGDIARLIKEFKLDW
jgi:hypothetical protein